jgi:hypothetical protein
VVLERMSLDDDTGDVLYRTRPSRTDHPEGPVACWEVYELIARLLDHLTAPNQQLTRYWGFYSHLATQQYNLPDRVPILTARPGPTPALPDGT